MSIPDHHFSQKRRSMTHQTLTRNDPLLFHEPEDVFLYPPDPEDLDHGRGDCPHSCRECTDEFDCGGDGTDANCNFDGLCDACDSHDNDCDCQACEHWRAEVEYERRDMHF